MAVRRKKTKSKTGRVSFKTGFSQLKKRRRTDLQNSSFRVFLKVLAVIFVFAAIVVGFVYLDKYVKKISLASGGTIDVELVEPPPWIDGSLREKIIASATSLWQGEDIELEEDTTRLIQNNLQRDIAWMQNIKVSTTHNKVLIEADYRKPVALIKLGARKLYVDAELVVLDFVPITQLPIVNIRGLATMTKMPLPGEVLQLEDLAAALAILEQLNQMDKLVTPDKPLLFEIDSIDVSNFKGRQSNRYAHIILYAKDNTEIIWGAEIDAWSQHLEAKDEEKLAKLYNYYKEFGSLTGGAKYIDLRTPQGKVPLPIDKYVP
jgi:hypothetical protein